MKKVWMMLAMAVTIAVAGMPSYQELCSAVTTPEGWSVEGKCDGMKMSGPMGEVVTATKKFVNGDKSLEVAVVSGMQAMGLWAPFMTGMTMENDEMLVKVEKIDDFPVGISYDKKEHSGGIVVKLASNAVMTGNFEQMDWKEALEILRKLDWKRLRSLFE
jgi:hypothetical protein